MKLLKWSKTWHVTQFTLTVTLIAVTGTAVLTIMIHSNSLATKCHRQPSLGGVSSQNHDDHHHASGHPSHDRMIMTR
eukprot:244110-Rhodomonas_salina.1